MRSVSGIFLVIGTCETIVAYALHYITTHIYYSIADDETKARAGKLAITAPGLSALVKANLVQQNAVIKALTQSFSLIHGPPGTGKTVTGVRIAYLFAKQNGEEDGHKKVLYCGPSNKSVEVVIGQ